MFKDITLGKFSYDCSTTTSKELMKKLRDMQVVIEVKGMGKGKYRLVYEGEIKSF